MESTIQVKNGKYTFLIKETVQDRDGLLLFTTIKMGGDYADCINASIDYKDNKPVSAKMPHVMYDEECAYSDGKILLQKGDGTKIMLQTLIAYIKQKYPSITEIKYDDMSSIECATETEIKNAKNRKRGTNVKPLPLYCLSIAYNGQTWYEKYFNARMQDADKHAKYRERVDLMLSSKPVDYNEFIKISYLPKQLWNELFEYYKTAETYSDFFHAIPKQDRCRLLLPWIDAFMRHHLHKVFSNNDWIIPLTVRGGGGKRKTQRRRGYMPTGILLSAGYSNNMGITMDEA